MSIVAQILSLYLIAGVAAALAFVSFGVAQVLPQPVTVSVGARLLIVPGAILLWPYVLLRWACAGMSR